MNLEGVIQDLQYAARFLRRSPTFSITAALTIALGIAANAAIFAVVQGLLLKPLPYPQPDQLVTVWQDMRARGGPATEWTTPGNLVDWRQETKVFASVATMRGWGPTLTGSGEPEPLRGEQVTADYFNVVGAPPALGRTFTNEDAIPNAPRVVVLTHEFWQQRFGGNAQILGTRLTLGGEPHEVIGVLAPGFRPVFIADAVVFRPDRLNLANPARGAVVLRMVARLQPGVTPEHASAAMAPVADRLAKQFPQNDKAGINVVPLQTYIVGNVRPGLLTLQGAVLLVLLVACVNIASLFLARASGRAREFAVRATLGAGRIRLVRQILTESLMLSVAGSVIGIAFSLWGVRALLALAPAGTPRLDEVSIDGGVFAFAALLAVATGVIFGLAPAYQLSRTRLAVGLKDGGRGSVGAGGHRLRRGLIVVEIGTALVLLIGGGLLLRSFVEMRRSNLGFDPSNVLVGFVGPPQAKYPEPAQKVAFVDRVLERVAQLPGVTDAAVTSIVPLNGGDSDMNMQVEGLPPARTPDEEPVAWYRIVSDRYFHAMGITISRGRGFAAREAEPSVVVTESLAAKSWPGVNPLGHRVRFSDDTPWFSVIGVTADVKQQGPRSDPRLQLFLPYWQVPPLVGAMNVVLKTATPPETLLAPLRLAVREIDPDIPVSGVSTMAALVADALAESRVLAFIVAIFAGLAALVAALGIYGLMSYTVTERRGELGVRVALGAERRDIFGLVLGEGLRLTAIGTVLGLAGGAALAPAIATLLFVVTPADPLTYSRNGCGFSSGRRTCGRRTRSTSDQSQSNRGASGRLRTLAEGQRGRGAEGQRKALPLCLFASLALCPSYLTTAGCG